MTTDIDLVLIGCGKIARLAHLPALARLQSEDLLKLAGVCDLDLPNAAAVAQQYRIPEHGADWKQLVQETQANAVAVCLPPGPNAEIASQALEMGLHVICEKPPGRNVAQANRMTAAAVAHPDRVHMIAFNRRFAPLYLRAMEHSSKLGAPRAFYGRFTRPSLGADPSDTATDWITSDGSHALDLAIATIGFPHSVSIGRQRAGVGPDNIWTIHLISDRGSAVILFAFTAGRRMERYEWVGPGYDVLLDMPNRGEWCQQGVPEQVWNASLLTQSTDFEVNYGFLGEYRCFANAIVGRGPKPDADFYYASSFMQLVDTLLRSKPGETHRVAQPGSLVRAVVGAVRSSAPSIQSAPPRPVVQFLQSTGAQGKHFTREQFSDLSKRCDLRLRTDDDGAHPDLSNVDVLVLGWGAPPVTADQLARASRLKIVVLVGASVSWAVPSQTLFDRGIVLCNTADAIAQSVAEHCLMLTLAGLRRLTEVNRGMRLGAWPPQSLRRFSAANLIKRARKLPLIETFKPMLKPFSQRVIAQANASARSVVWNDLQGQVVGLVGWGHIARRFADLLRPFHCRLLVCSEFASREELSAFDAQPASLGEVLGVSKVISLHKALTERTKGILDERTLALIQRGSVLVNTARAGLVDEAALIARARKGDIVIALDVFHEEPLPKRHPLRQFENVILSPHSASSTPQCNRRVGEAAVNILLDWLESRPVPELNAARLLTMS